MTRESICHSCDVSSIQLLSLWCSLVNMMERQFYLIYIIFLFIYFASNWATQREKRELIHTNKDYHQLTQGNTQGNPAGNCKRGISSPPLPILNIWCCLYYTLQQHDIWIFWDWRWADRRECPRLRKVIFKLAEIANIGSRQIEQT